MGCTSSQLSCVNDRATAATPEEAHDGNVARHDREVESPRDEGHFLGASRGSSMLTTHDITVGGRLGTSGLLGSSSHFRGNNNGHLFIHQFNNRSTGTTATNHNGSSSTSRNPLTTPHSSSGVLQLPGATGGGDPSLFPVNHHNTNNTSAFLIDVHGGDGGASGGGGGMPSSASPSSGAAARRGLLSPLFARRMPTMHHPTPQPQHYHHHAVVATGNNKPSSPNTTSTMWPPAAGSNPLNSSGIASSSSLPPVPPKMMMTVSQQRSSSSTHTSGVPYGGMIPPQPPLLSPTPKGTSGLGNSFTPNNTSGRFGFSALELSAMNGTSMNRSGMMTLASGGDVSTLSSNLVSGGGGAMSRQQRHPHKMNISQTIKMFADEIAAKHMQLTLAASIAQRGRPLSFYLADVKAQLHDAIQLCSKNKRDRQGLYFTWVTASDVDEHGQKHVQQSASSSSASYDDTLIPHNNSDGTKRRIHDKVDQRHPHEQTQTDGRPPRHASPPTPPPPRAAHHLSAATTTNDHPVGTVVRFTYGKTRRRRLRARPLRVMHQMSVDCNLAAALYPNDIRRLCDARLAAERLHEQYLLWGQQADTSSSAAPQQQRGHSGVGGGSSPQDDTCGLAPPRPIASTSTVRPPCSLAAIVTGVPVYYHHVSLTTSRRLLQLQHDSDPTRTLIDPLRAHAPPRIQRKIRSTATNGVPTAASSGGGLYGEMTPMSLVIPAIARDATPATLCSEVCVGSSSEEEQALVVSLVTSSGCNADRRRCRVGSKRLHASSDAARRTTAATAPPATSQLRPGQPTHRAARDLDGDTHLRVSEWLRLQNPCCHVPPTKKQLAKSMMKQPTTTTQQQAADNLLRHSWMNRLPRPIYHGDYVCTSTLTPPLEEEQADLFEIRIAFESQYRSSLPHLNVKLPSSFSEDDDDDEEDYGKKESHNGGAQDASREDDDMQSLRSIDSLDMLC